MIKKELLNDQNFDSLYTEEVRKHSFIHWTPAEIVETAIDWLRLDATSKVLDIGSGAGKFCVMGALMSKARFTGIERREDLVEAAEKLKKDIGVTNVTFINEDIVNVDFKAYHAFYYYNPFCEYIAEFDRIDDTVEYSPDIFRIYEDHVVEELEKLSKGVRVVTYCSQAFPFPSSYELRDMLYDGKLALWVKTK